MSICQVGTHPSRSESGWPYRVRGNGSVVPSVIGAIAASGPEFAKHIARRVRINADRRRLAGMPDHILKDIGIGRSEIDYRVEYGRAEEEARMLGLTRK